MLNHKDYESDFENKWCPGCGNFGILAAMQDALASLGVSPQRTLIVSGIGQAAKTPHFMKCNLLHGLHGRALPLATGAKIANQDLNIIVNSGDGDCYGEGGYLFMHAIRRNVDITLLVHNNKVYGLTKGQASPTSDMGMITKMQPHGVAAETFNPLTVALALGAGFVARGFSGHKTHLSHLIREGIRYRGLSLIDILQPCVSFNRVNTFAWYKKRVYDLETEGHHSGHFEKAMTLARQWGERIPIGIFYRKTKPTFMDQIKALKKEPLIDQTYQPQKLKDLLNSLN